MQMGTNAANTLLGLVLSCIEAECCRNIEDNIFVTTQVSIGSEHIFDKISDLNLHSDHALKIGSRVKLNFRDEVCISIFVTKYVSQFS